MKLNGHPPSRLQCPKSSWRNNHSSSSGNREAFSVLLGLRLLPVLGQFGLYATTQLGRSGLNSKCFRRMEVENVVGWSSLKPDVR